MKKIVPIFISLMILLSGCASKPDYTGSEYVGDWQAVKLVLEDQSIKDDTDLSDSDVEQLVELGVLLPDGKINLATFLNSNDLSDTTLKLSKNGISVMQVSGRKTTGYWKESQDGVIIIGRTNEYKAKKNDDGTLTVKRYGAIITYEKQ